MAIVDEKKVQHRRNADRYIYGGGEYEPKNRGICN